VSFILSAEQLRQADSDRERAEWLSRAPLGFFAHARLEIIRSHLAAAGFVAGLDYLEAEHAAQTAQRTRGDVPFTINMNRNYKLLTMLNRKSWRAST
jgi:hypothetical protein